jgi:aminoglycoside phosphotransferase (APT) family kinase protein
MEAPAPPGIDAPRVRAFFERALPQLGTPTRFELISGGRSNLTYRVECPAGPCVLRRPPLGHVLPTAHDMAREHRVLAALADTDVPVARPLALCTDEAVNGAPFYVMEYRAGIVANERMPEGYATEPAERRGIGLALVDVLARLHALDYVALGLAEFGRPEGYLERQVRRWAAQWEKSKAGELPEIEALIVRLRAALPASPRPTLVHGDYRLGNVALDPADPTRIVAVFDWEMATLGDPLADLGYTLIYWGEAADAPEARMPGGFQAVTAVAGFPTRAELVAEYARRSGRAVDHVDFYQVLALYKLAVISEGIYARHLQGKTVGRGFENLTRSSVALARQALTLADRSASPALRGSR